MTPGIVAVTGANGFVGQAVTGTLRSRGLKVRPVVRTESATVAGAVTVGRIGPDTDWSAALQGVDCVIHCAARVHVMQEQATNPLALFRLVNVAGTRRLAEQAAASGVRRLVFVSSIKVNGDVTELGEPFTLLDRPTPQDEYARTKMEAELALRGVESRTGLDIVVIRPPLTYGPGVRGNFQRLMQLVKKGRPLPFGLVDNRRSLVALDNLVDLLITCIDHDAAAGQTFLVSDGEDLSTPELIRRIACAMGRPARLLPVPVALLRLGGRLAGRSMEVERLVGSLQIDKRHTCETLNWRPPVSVDEGILSTVAPLC